MTTKAPTPAPTYEDFVNATALLETLTSDTIVKRLKGGIEVGAKHPLDNHFYVCFFVPDAARPRNVFIEYLEPAIRKMAGMLSDIPMIAVQPLPGCPETLAVCRNFPDSVWPLRFITHRDSLREGLLVTIDLFCRQIDMRDDMLIYFLRKKGTTDQYYQRRGGRKYHYGEKRGARDPKWGPMTTAACWTSPNGPCPVKGSDGEIVAFPLTIEKERTL